MSSFIDTTSPPGPFLPYGISDKLDVPAELYAYAAHPQQAMFKVDPTSGL
jgi:hypothetical protein